MYNRISHLLTRSFSAASKTKPKRKVIKVGENRPIIMKRREINAQHEKKASEMGLEFRILGASVLHRYPTITKDPYPWEIAKQEVDDAIAAKQREYFNTLVKGTDAEKLVPDEQMDIDSINKTLAFEPASRITEADKTNNHKTHHRKLQESLFLVTKRNRQDFAWQFPQGKNMEGESLRETAERVGDRAYGKKLGRYYMSNAPMGHIIYEYPKELQEKRQQYGAKVFFYRCQLLDDLNFKLETRLYTDYAWISREEVYEYMDKDTAEYMEALLLE